MPSWKLCIFVNAVKIRYSAKEGSYEEILETYSKLTVDEKAEIRSALSV